MHVPAPRRAAAALLAAAGLVLALPAGSAAANPLSSPSHTLFVVKDLGGGAYWNVTTNSMYALQQGSGAVIDAAQLTADLVATLASDGRNLLLLINGAILVPVGDALGG